MNQLISSAPKFDKYEPKQQEKDKVISDMKTDMSTMNEKIEKLEEIVDWQGQYLRQNRLLLHSTAENKGQNTNDFALKIVNEKMNIELSRSALERTHRIGCKKE